MTCPVCKGTGEVGTFGILDCSNPGCGAAEERNALDLAIAKLNADEGRMHPHDERWAAYQLGKPKWQPIETAPKNGALVLLGSAEDEANDRSAISTPGRWHDGYEDGPDDIGHDGGFMDDEFQQFTWPRSFGAESYRTAGFQPTHWMPLPAPPEF